MVSPTLKPKGRALTDFQNTSKHLKSLEQMLLIACRNGGVLKKISEQPPEQATAENTVCADFLRFLALGGDENAPVHEMGVVLCDAWVEGDLDLRGAILPHSLVLDNCHLNTVICMMHAQLGREGSNTPLFDMIIT